MLQEGEEGDRWGAGVICVCVEMGAGGLCRVMCVSEERRERRGSMCICLFASEVPTLHVIDQQCIHHQRQIRQKLDRGYRIVLYRCE